MDPFHEKQRRRVITTLAHEGMSWILTVIVFVAVQAPAAIQIIAAAPVLLTARGTRNWERRRRGDGAWTAIGSALGVGAALVTVVVALRAALAGEAVVVAALPAGAA